MEQKLETKNFGLDFFAYNGETLNAAVITGSASGRHLLSCDMITNIISDSGTVVIFDFGRNYKQLCELLGGLYLQANGLRMNPFCYADMDLSNNSSFTERICERNQLLQQVIKLMIEYSTDLENCFQIQQEINDLLYNFFILINPLDYSVNGYSVKGFLDYLLYLDKSAPGNKIRSYISAKLESFLEKSAGVFNAQVVIDNFELTNPPKLIVIEFEDLIYDKRLLDVTYNTALLILSNIFGNLRNSDTRLAKCMFVLDEIEFTFGNTKISPIFIEEMLRRAKDKNISIVSFTRKLSYYFDNTAIESLYKNSAQQIFIRPDDSDFIEKMVGAEIYEMIKETFCRIERQQKLGEILGVVMQDNMAHFINFKPRLKPQIFSDEKIDSVLSASDNLLIVGQIGSGKTKLINRILRQLEQQADVVYVLICPNLVNHTGDDSYGHLNALRLNVDDLNESTAVVLQNTAITFPYAFGQYSDDILAGQLYPYVDKLSEQCAIFNKKFFIVSDGMDSYCNYEFQYNFNPYKRIISITNNENIKELIPQFNTIQL